jgi:DNA-binding response OmpR family regulator
MASMEAATRILLVEDEVSISAPLASVLEREGFVPAVAATAAEALRMVRSIEPEVVLLDLTLPDGDGRDVCREIRVFSDVPIIMLTARGTEVDRIVGLEIGADDYVVKPFSSGELVARIRALLRRTDGSTRTPAAYRVDGLELDESSRRATLDGEPLELSRKEFDLLAELVRSAGKVVSREELMAAVWDENWFGSTKTLDVHIGWLRKKLGDDPADPHYLHTIRGVGFRFATTGES